ncbi:winged helix-turn-helix domain-containing protein [Rheinheimera sp. 1928-s]|uniref:winged helix-turn-helix domain-containing protein n=1 Tax=Rheinheimera sp. 1928-s TaxID=3033803 RepID=UPI002605B511|nr:winged helix-turn-helix domain-containing protein [Rheinheimera sp. 1928-s]MDF3123527.1 winged helix-turn-helix domain-containing protein [Rheinheimera sp. 1928-s]
MLKQFKLNDIRVDVDRCFITRGQESVTVEPRTMDVLAYLAAHPKQVVSQESLFEELWPNTVFSPGSVQRSIAQLRKALGDEAKTPVYIHTHTKRGYSLEVEPLAITTQANHWRWWLFSCLLALFVMIWGFWPDTKAHISFSGKLQPITSSSYYDFMPLYSADGSALAFIRQTGASNQIVVKDLHSSDEKIILSGSDDYQSITWDQSNSSFYIIVRAAAGDWVGKISRHGGPLDRLFSVDEQGGLWRLDADKSGLYYMLATVPINGRPVTRLKHFNEQTKIHTDLLLSSNEFTPYRIALSPDTTVIALAGENASNDVELRSFHIKTAELSQPFAKLPLGFTEINWHPNNQSLLVHHLNELFIMGLDGSRSDIPYFSYQRIFNPSFSPAGDKIVLSLSRYDTDLIEVGRRDFIDKIVDSAGEDHLARYSPSGREIAFVSSRTGRSQLFLYRDGQQKLIFDNSENQPIYRAPVWSKDGNRIAFSFGKILYIYSIEDQTTVAHKMPAEFTAVLDWYSDKDKLLIATKRSGSSYFERYQLSKRVTIRLAETGVNFSARLDQDDKLLYRTEEFLFWGERKFSLQSLPPMTGAVVPVKGGVLFQSQRDLYQFDGVSAIKLSETLPDLVSELIDAYSTQQMLFCSQPEENADIVLLE